MTLAVVTGASSGIGEAVVKRLAHEPGARLLLVARRGDRLRTLAESLPCPADVIAVDLTDETAPDVVAAAVAEHGGSLDVLINNAGAAWRATFAEAGYANVARTMAVNFDAVVRLTEALLPVLRVAAPSAIVNVASVAARVSRPGAGAYSASKAALCAWSDSLYCEEHAHGVHVGLVLPGFVATEGFPARELLARRATRGLVGTTDEAADAVVRAALQRRAEIYSPRGYRFAAALRSFAPGLMRAVQRGGPGRFMTTGTGADAVDAALRGDA